MHNTRAWSIAIIVTGCLVLIALACSDDSTPELLQSRAVFSWSTSNDAAVIGDWDSLYEDDPGDEIGCAFSLSGTHIEGTGSYNLTQTADQENLCYLVKAVTIYDYTTLTFHYRTEDFNTDPTPSVEPLIWIESGDASLRLFQWDDGRLREAMATSGINSISALSSGTWYTITIEMDVPATALTISVNGTPWITDTAAYLSWDVDSAIWIGANMSSSPWASFSTLRYYDLFDFVSQDTPLSATSTPTSTSAPPTVTGTPPTSTWTPRPSRTPSPTPSPTVTRTPGPTRPTATHTVSPTPWPDVTCPTAVVTIDANLADWAAIPATPMALSAADAAYIWPAATPSVADLSGTFWCAHSADTFFLSGVITDSVLYQDSAPIDDDAAQIAIDGWGDGFLRYRADDHELTVTQDGRLRDLATLPITATVATTLTVGGWQFEIGIPRSVIELPTLTQRLIGLVFGLIDDDDGGQLDQQIIAPTRTVLLQ